MLIIYHHTLWRAVEAVFVESFDHELFIIFKVDLRLFLNLGAYLQENAALIKAVGEKERGEERG